MYLEHPDSSRMEDKSALLRQLRVDRDVEPPRRGRGRRLGRWLVFCVILLGAAAAAWFMWLMPQGVPVRAAVAHPASASAGAVPVSVLDASGYVIPERQATVSAKVTGKLVAVLIKEGQHVAEGQIVATIDDSNAAAALAQAKANVGEAKANLAAAKTALADALPTYTRNKRQAAEGLITPEALDDAKAKFDAAQSRVDVSQQQTAVADANLLSAQRNLDDYTVRAPFAGVITAKNAQPGEIVSPLATGGFTRTGIATLVDMDSLEIEVDVSENYINRIHPGQPAVATLNAYPDWHIPAKVTAVIPTADQSKATVKVRLAFRDEDPRILPEMGIRVSFMDDAAPTADVSKGVVVPAEGVRARGDTGVVFAIYGDRVKEEPVRLGKRVADGQIILSGLSSGERIAIGDLSKLADGAKIRLEQ